VDQLLDRRAHFPGDAASPGLARRFVRSALHEAGLSALADDALLLTSELCENAVLHAGTGFEVGVACSADSVTITVTDHGSTAMELRRGLPSERRDTHNRGLQIVAAVATAWGSRHDAAGHHVWFTLGSVDSEDVPLGPSTVEWPAAPVSRWLLHLPAGDDLTLEAVVTELIRRLCDVLPATGARVFVDYGRGEEELATYGEPTDTGMITVALHLFTPRSGRLCVYAPPSPTAVELAELTATRLGVEVESDWARGAARERRTWLTYLAEASELLTHSLDVRLTTAMVPQLVVPRLGAWAAVHLLDERRRLQLGALTHVDETAIPRLRMGLAARAEAVLVRLMAGGSDALGLPSPVDGVAVPLRLGDRILGTLAIGRPADRPHAPEEIMMITELSRRAAQAIDNAQRNAAHVATAHALQQALLPRALPVAEGITFTATYQPGTGTDVGGDFYDVVTLTENCWLAAIGDVCGKGPRAAARTSLVRDVLRVLVRQGSGLADSLGLLHEMMMEAGDPDQFATVALALVSLTPSGTLAVELVLAGHDQPALVRADSTVELVGQHGSAVGLVSPFSVFPTHHTLGAGDSLVLYTDGITERRRGHEQFGVHRLVQTLGSSSREQLVGELQRAAEGFSGEPPQDDMAILAIQVPGG
jgi:sigma-B regulation protein RsbU (phosphoserine phosphatase)